VKQVSTQVQGGVNLREEKAKQEKRKLEKEDEERKKNGKRTFQSCSQRN